MFLFFTKKPACLALVFSLFLVFCSDSPLRAQTGEGPENPVQIFNQGQDAHEKGDLKTAIELYEKALKLVPEFPEAEYQLGSALLSFGKTAEAEAAFRRALALRADWTLPMAGLGSILVGKNQLAEAEQILTRALELDELNFPAYSALVELRLKAKASPDELKKILTRLQFLTTTKSNLPAAIWAARGSLERALGDQTAAKASIARALAIEPNNLTALGERVELALSESDFDKALESARQLEQAAPAAPGPKFLLARVYAEMGNGTEALKILGGIENPSAEVISFRNKIVTISTTDAAALEARLAGEPRNSQLLGRLCSLLRTENPAKALEYCRRAAEAEPTNLTYVIGFGAALVQAKRFEDAVTVFRRIVEAAPDNFTGRANLATALFQLKRYEEAKKEYIWLAEKQPELAITYYFLAITHDQLNEYLDAMANYQRFLRLADPDKNKLEIEKVNLRLPSLQRQIKAKKGNKK